MTNRRARAPKRGHIWLPFYAEEVAVAAGGSAETGDLLGRYFLDVGRATPAGTTLGPVLGIISMTSTTVGLTPDVFAAMRLRREEDTGTPNIELEPIDAMWYGHLMSRGTVQEVAAGTFSTQAENFVIETHAMRKTKSPAERLTIQFDEASSDGGATIRVALHTFMKFP